MDKTLSSSCTEETGMEKVLSDLDALKKLYGLLPTLDETSRALLKKLLDSSTHQALLKQAKALTTPSDPVVPFTLGLASPKKMDQATQSTSSFLNNKEAEMEQILSDLQALTKLYSLLHKGPADENLDEASKALLMKILEDATQEAVRRQAKMLVSPALERKLSMRSECRTPQADPRLRPVASPRPSLLASGRSRQLNLQHSTVSRRSGLHVDGHRNAAEEPPLVRLASKHSSRTALPARHRPSQEQQHSSLSLHRFPAAGTSIHGTVTGGTRLANRWDSISRNSSCGDQRSLERSSSRRSSNRCSVSRRSGLHVEGHRHAAEEPPLVRLASKHSSRTAFSAQHRPNQEQQHSSLSLHWFPGAGTSRHGTVTGGTRLANSWDSISHNSSCGDRWSLERSSSRRSSSRRSVSSRSGLHVDGHRHAAEEPPLVRLASKHSSRTALPARHRPSQYQRHSSLSLHRFPAAGTSRHGTVTGGTRLANGRDSIRRSSGRGDQWSLERSSSSSSSSSIPRSSGRGDQWLPERSSSSRSSSRRSMSQELSLGSSSRLHGRATPQHVEAESSSLVHLFERLDCGSSLSMTSRHGVEHAGRGVATPEHSSSSKTMATIHSRIRPSNNLLKEGSLRRAAAAEEGWTSRRRQQGMYSSSMSSLSASTSPTASPPSPPPRPRRRRQHVRLHDPDGAANRSAPAPRAFATPYYYSPPAMTRGIAPPVYAPEVSLSMWRRRCQEILKKRVARLRMVKDKFSTVCHHLQDQHHHRHLGAGQEAGPSSRSIVHGATHHNSPWQHLTTMFHHAKEQYKSISSRAVAGAPEKRRGGGGGGNMLALFGAARRHLKGKSKRRGGGGNMLALFGAARRHLKGKSKRRGGGGNMHALFDAVGQHLKGKRSAPAPAGIKLRRKASRGQAKKMQWWQQLRQRRGMAGLTAGSRPRHRLGDGKGGWL